MNDVTKQLRSKLDTIVWEETSDELRLAIEAAVDEATALRLEVETLRAEAATVRLGIGDIQKVMRDHDFFSEGAPNTLQQVHERVGGIAAECRSIRDDMVNQLGAKLDLVAWEEAVKGMHADVEAVRSAVSSLRSDVAAAGGSAQDLEKQRVAFESDWKAKLDAVHGLLGGKVSKEAAEGLSNDIEVMRGTVSTLSLEVAAVKRSKDDLQACIHGDFAEAKRQLFDAVRQAARECEAAGAGSAAGPPEAAAHKGGRKKGSGRQAGVSDKGPLGAAA